MSPFRKYQADNLREKPIKKDEYSPSHPRNNTIKVRWWILPDKKEKKLKKKAARKQDNTFATAGSGGDFSHTDKDSKS